MKAFFSAEDLRQRARRRLPGAVFDYIDGGAGRESAVQRNQAALGNLRLIPRVAVGNSFPSIGISLFGNHYSAPFGIAPMGLCNLAASNADIVLAKAAKNLQIPYINATPSTTSMETITETIGTAPWFQLYCNQNSDITKDLINRAKGLGCPVLVVTLDMPIPGLRLRDARNNFRHNRSNLAAALLKPKWLLGMAKSGIPDFANLEKYAGGIGNTRAMASNMSQHSGGGPTWEILRQIRDQWPAKLVLKGIMDPRDGELAVKIGADGIVVSNHGGRQLDSAPASIEAVSEVRATVGKNFTVLVDGGFGSGEDIVKALAYGADFVLIGRPFLYSLAAFGNTGPQLLIDGLIDDLQRTLVLLGASGINPEILQMWAQN